MENETLRSGVDGGDRIRETIDGVEEECSSSAANLVGWVTTVWGSAQWVWHSSLATIWTTFESIDK